MKSSAWDNKLWQNKMQELPVTGDANGSWQKMAGLLDAELPVTGPAGAAKPNLWASRLLKVLVVIVAAAALYFAVIYLFKHGPENKKSPVKQEKHTTNKNTDQLKNNGTNSTPDGTIAVKNNAETKVNNTTVKNATAATQNNKQQSSQGTNVGQNSADNKPSSAIGADNGGISHQAIKPTTNIGALKNTGVSGGKNGKKLNRSGHQHATNLASVILGGRGTNLNHHSKGKFQHQKVGGTNAGNSNQASNNSQAQTKYKNALDSVNASLVKNNMAPVTPLVTTSSPTPDSSSLSASKTASSQKIPDTTANPTDGKPGKAGVKGKSKPKTPKTSAQIPVFDVGIKAGLNTGSGSKNVFGAVAGTYNISQKFGVGIGVNILTQKPISGSYSNDHYTYTTPDTGHKVITHTADKLTVKSSVTRYTVDVPVIATYRINRVLSINAGSVIGIPIRAASPKNTLSPFSNPIDTLAAYKTITNAANSTTISNKVNFSVIGGVTLNLGRFYIDGNYVQGVSPYTISSALGSTKVYYHSVQVGIGYKIFRSKKKR